VLTKERLLARAALLRATISAVDDPLAQRIIKAVIEALEEIAAEQDSSGADQPPDDSTDTSDK
jgi:hypothetical protein